MIGKNYPNYETCTSNEVMSEEKLLESKISEFQKFNVVFDSEIAKLEKFLDKFGLFDDNKNKSISESAGLQKSNNFIFLKELDSSIYYYYSNLSRLEELNKRINQLL